jgi:hypothetical protein
LLRPVRLSCGVFNEDQSMITALSWAGNFVLVLGSVVLIVAVFSDFGGSKNF